ncbi:MAG: glycosyltransferase [Verrucomicrobiae bacterium]|nr:glycosyltransferase [Verrucomicrobiae bacterium]
MISGTKEKKRVWLVSAHFPPSNLVSVHRARMLANHLGARGWSPTVLCVAPEYYEEKLDPELEKLVEPSVRVIRVPAISPRVARPLGWGDIGLRGWPYLYRALAEEARQGRVEVVHITLPNNYQSLLGRLLWERHGVPYILDYMDPWVYESDQGDRFPSKAWGSQFLAKRLEPLAVARASGIMGITARHFAGAVRRNPQLAEAPQLAAQYGSSQWDQEKVKALKIEPRRLERNAPVRQIVYAGGIWPKAVDTMRAWLRAMGEVNRQLKGAKPFRLVCLGTGNRPSDPESFQVLPLAREEGVAEWVREYPERHSFLEVLATLAAAEGSLIIGSTEPHYSPSKLFQCVLARRPVAAVLFHECEGLGILRESGAGMVIPFVLPWNAGQVTRDCANALRRWPEHAPDDVRWDLFRDYDMENIATQVARFYDEVMDYNQRRKT